MTGDKLIGLPEAVTAHVQPGRTVYLGNFGAQLFAVGHEIIRQGRTGLHVVVGSGGILLDQLLGAGALASATFGHCWSPVGPGPTWNFRRAAESGDRAVTLYELSLGLMTAALTAGAWGVPFMPVPGLPGTGYTDEDWPNGRMSRVDTAFGTADIVAAITPDVAFVHVDQADADGNGVIRGPLGEALVAAQAARALVLVAEEVVGTEAARRAGIVIPGVLTTAVVHHPGAVAPDGTIGRYERDVAAYERYVAGTSTPEGFAAWLSEHVTGGRDA
ncbi:CoA transferase subunit A [Nonomuraea sp. C10]|uniref:CoA transferase subunit A n=1 Tax=Nonomuraea sp. C10 TaxID=2600577 RepID=UPI0011CD613E|nr:CoA-transferase [Nonomuraea sp. C10]TXK38955.1 CoA-transferase [Nonomuraea sp. C10]